MKCLLFISILLFSSLVSYNQEIVVVDSTFAKDPYMIINESRKCRIYRVKEADKTIRAFGHKVKPGNYLSDTNEGMWGLFFFDKVLPEDLKRTLLLFTDEGNAKENIFYIVLYFDVKGQIISMEYVIEDSVRKEVLDRQLKLLYENLMKEKFVMSDPMSVTQERMRRSNEIDGRSNEIFFMRFPLIRFNWMIREIKAQKDSITWKHVKSLFKGNTSGSTVDVTN